MAVVQLLKARKRSKLHQVRPDRRAPLAVGFVSKGIVVSLPDAADVDAGPGAGQLTIERIYDERFDDVKRWVRAFGCRPPDVADLVHDVFVIALRRLPEFDGQNVRGWLFAITTRKVRDYRRLSWIKHLFTEESASTVASMAVGVDQVERFATAERRILMDRIWNKLPATERVALELFELDGLACAEIAKLQRISINTVWGRLHRARHRLQSRLLRLEADSKSRQGLGKALPW
jgi:RNA polymerase sigma-70 factor (ECF subfamily)